jgi:hypothetical protein
MKSAKARRSNSYRFARAVSLSLALFVSFSAGVVAFEYGKQFASAAQLNSSQAIRISLFLLISIGVIAGVLLALLQERLQLGVYGQRKSLQALKTLIDLVPPPKLRRRLVKLLADQSAHVIQLRKHRRYTAAYWIVLTTWLLAGWYALLSPFHALWGMILAPLRGAGD